MKKKWIVWGIFTIVLICVVYTMVMYTVFHGTNGDSDRGTFGDMFGALNTFFSALAFGGLIYTIILQRSDLKLQMEVQEDQIKELALQREEAKRSGDALNEQRQLMNLQRVESTVHQILRSIDGNALILNNLHDYNNMNFFVFHKYFLDNHKADISESPDEFYKRTLNDQSFMPTLEKYLNTILFALQYIDKSDVHEDNKFVFAGLLKLNLGEPEIDMLNFYLKLSKFEDEVKQHYRGLLEKYGIV